MADGGTPNFEQAPNRPERALEVPETGASFETPAAPVAEVPAPVQPAVRAAAPAAPVPQKDATTLGVERILEEDLAETYAKMKPALKAKFRKEGERVTARIVAMVRDAKVKAREVLQLISNWLKLIPGANRFFLIQEAKIKTDKIVAMGEETKRNAGGV